MTEDRIWDSERQRWVYRDELTEAPHRKLAGKALHHIDGDPLNNDPANLRIVDVTANLREPKT